MLKRETMIEVSPGALVDGVPRITLARAMVLRAPSATFPSHTLDANFAVQLEIGPKKGAAVATGLITRFEGIAFPKTLWPLTEQICHKLTGRSFYRYSTAFPGSLWLVVEELCRKLAGSHLDRNAEQLLREVAREAALGLEEQNHTKLSLRLASIITQNRKPGVRLRSWLNLSFNLRERVLYEGLTQILQVFSTALRQLTEEPLSAFNSQSGVQQRSEQWPESSEHWLDSIEHSCCFPEAPLPSYQGKPANIFPDAAFLQSHPKDATKGHLLEREALAHGLAVLRFPNGSFIASDRNGRRLNFKWSRSPVTSAVALALCCHKDATRSRLRRCALPVPRGRTFAGGDYKRAAAYVKSNIGYPVVLKPAAGLRGVGVISNIGDESELQTAFQLHAQSELGGDDFVVEQHVQGEDYRIVVIGMQVVSAIRRIPASVCGDGLHTVMDLILAKNKIRTLNPHLRRRLINFDQATFHMLGQSGLTLESVPAKDQWVQLATSNNISRGGDSIEVVDELHSSISEAAVRAVAAIPGLGFCGLDILLEDHTKPIHDQAAVIIELNAHGAIGTGQYPMWGTPRNVARHFLLYCAEREGLVLSDFPAERLSVKFQVRGKVTGVGYRRWFRHKAKEYGLTGLISTTNRTTLQGSLDGETAPVAALMNAAVRGPRRAIPYWVSIEHVAPV